MIQVTYDEYKQYYMKHDTWSLFLEEKKKEKEKSRDAEGFHFLICSSLLKADAAKESILSTKH